MKLSDLTHPFRRSKDTSLPDTGNGDDLGFGDKVITTGGRLNQSGWIFQYPQARLSILGSLSVVGRNELETILADGVGFLSGGQCAICFFLYGLWTRLFNRPSFRYWFLGFFSFITFSSVFKPLPPSVMDQLVPLVLVLILLQLWMLWFGLMSFALATGLVFARFSKPKAQILFSENAIITPYRHRQTGKKMDSLQFRLVNARNNKLINLEVTVVMTWLDTLADGTLSRSYGTLPLERYKVTLLPLNWTIVHPIDKHSPLYRKTCPDLVSSQTEILIMIEGYDDTFAQTVHDNGSYTCHEIKWGVKFAPMYFAEDGHTVLELDRLDETVGLEEE